MNMLTRIRQAPMGEEEKDAIRRQELHQKVREARVAIARKVEAWTELEESALVKRGRWWVHADTDELFVDFLGTVWVAGRADVVSDRSPLYFCVLADGVGLAFFERVKNPPTYTAFLEHRDRKARA